MSFSPRFKKIAAQASMVALGTAISVYAYWPMIMRSVRGKIAEWEPESVPTQFVEPLAKVQKDEKYVDKYPRIVSDSNYKV